jgi:hypothetical protein
MGGSVVNLFQQYAGRDIAKQFNQLNVDPVILDIFDRQRVCLRNFVLDWKSW